MSHVRVTVEVRDANGHDSFIDLTRAINMGNHIPVKIAQVTAEAGVYAEQALHSKSFGQENPSDKIIEQVMDAQANLQTALGLYRLDQSIDVEKYLALSLVTLKDLLASLGKPMP